MEGFMTTLNPNKHTKLEILYSGIIMSLNEIKLNE